LSTYHREGRPHTGCSTFGRADFIRFPLPAASTTAASDRFDAGATAFPSSRARGRPVILLRHRGSVQPHLANGPGWPRVLALAALSGRPDQAYRGEAGAGAGRLAAGGPSSNGKTPG